MSATDQTDNPTQQFTIAGRPVGDGCPCFVIAEAGVNHNGDLDLARRLIDVAAEAGADAVKFQTWKTSCLVTNDAPLADYQKQNLGQQGSQCETPQYEMLRRLELKPHSHAVLQQHCRQRGVMFLSTPFDEPSTDLLVGLDVPALKIPSGEVTNGPLLAHIARSGRPVIMSTGMCRLDEVEAAVDTLRRHGNRELILLHCVSNYPADPAEANLRAMDTLRQHFDVPVGFSDHTPGVEVSLAAVVLGACVVEKHFTLDRTLPGPDHKASLEPDELVALVRGIHTVESALGDGRKMPTASETNTADVARKSLTAAVDIPAGTVLRPELIAIRRPGTGLPPSMREELLGRTVQCDIPAGTLLDRKMVA